MNKKTAMRVLTKKEMESVAGGWGIIYGKPKGGGGFWVQGYLGKKTGRG
ncbi:hypothetical protein [Erwinia sp. HR93]|nr:hypothetical protein [Erwinia sp. HR93]MEA1064858.1 hypothetical protein [Erwinia sp. HR93]